MIGLGSGAMKMVTWSPQSCWHSSSLTTFSWEICHQISFGHLTLNKLSKKWSAYKNWILCVDSFLHIVTTHKHTCGGGDVCRVLSDDGECGGEAELGSGKLCKTDASQNQHGIKVSKTDASRPPPRAQTMDLKFHTSYQIGANLLVCSLRRTQNAVCCANHYKWSEQLKLCQPHFWFWRG